MIRSGNGWSIDFDKYEVSLTSESNLNSVYIEIDSMFHGSDILILMYYAVPIVTHRDLDGKVDRIIPHNDYKLLLDKEYVDKIENRNPCSHCGKNV